MLMRTTRFWYNLHQLRFWYNLHQLRFWYNLHQLRFWYNLHQLRFWYNRHQLRFWYNLHQLRFWYNLHQLRFWYNLHQLRSISKDWKAILFKNNLKIPKGHSEAVNRQYNGQQKNDKQRSKNILWSKRTKQYTVEPAHGVTCTKKLPFCCPVIENFI